MRKLRRSTEAEVIAEFLKNEFYQEEFHADRESFERLVLEADLTSEDENALRRALLFRRRGHMWREVPSDTQWWEVELEPEDLNFVRVFPRAQWRKVADESFLLRDIVNRIRTVRFSGARRDFIARVQALSYRLRAEHDRSAVLLIGVDEQNPLTILEGNHRLTAALLAGPAVISQQFRVLCGFSPHMSSSCWYETNLPNLWRYGQNRLRNLFYDRDADVGRVLRQISNASHASPAPALDGCITPVRAGKIIEGSK
jgi:hypothetical protein